MGIANILDHTSKGPNKGGGIVYQCLEYMMSLKNHWAICIDTFLNESSYI